MKKTLRMILCLVLTLSLMACFAACDLFGDDDDEGGSSKSGSSVAGTYQFYEMTQDGETITLSDLEEAAEYYGMDVDEFCYLELNKDGTGTLCFMGEEMEMEWDDTYIWPVDDEDDTVEYKLSGSKLSLEQDGMEMVFKK